MYAIHTQNNIYCLYDGFKIDLPLWRTINSFNFACCVMWLMTDECQNTQHGIHTNNCYVVLILFHFVSFLFLQIGCICRTSSFHTASSITIMIFSHFKPQKVSINSLLSGFASAVFYIMKIKTAPYSEYQIWQIGINGSRWECWLLHNSNRVLTSPTTLKSTLNNAHIEKNSTQMENKNTNDRSISWLFNGH